MKRDRNELSYPRAGAQIAFARGATAFGAFSVGAVAFRRPTQSFWLQKKSRDDRRIPQRTHKDNRGRIDPFEDEAIHSGTELAILGQI